jgi:hypothetical protein
MYRLPIRVATRRSSSRSVLNSTGFDHDEAERRRLVIDAQARILITAERLTLDRARAGREHDVLAVEHKPHRDDMRPAVLPGGRDLGGTGAFHDERVPLLFGHAAHRTRAYSASQPCLRFARLDSWPVAPNERARSCATGGKWVPVRSVVAVLEVGVLAGCGEQTNRPATTPTPHPDDGHDGEEALFARPRLAFVRLTGCRNVLIWADDSRRLLGDIRASSPGAGEMCTIGETRR